MQYLFAKLIIKAISGDILEVSQGTVFGWLEALHQRAEVKKEKIENHLLDLPQVCTDPTTVSMDGRQAYVRNFSSRHWVL